MEKPIYIVVSTFCDNLEKEVNSKIKEGYVPIGGVSFSGGNVVEWSNQAMVLKDKI